MSLLDVPRRRVLQFLGATTAAVAGGGAMSAAADEDDGDERGEGERGNGDDRDEDEDDRDEDDEAEVEFEEQTVEAAGTPTVYVEDVEVPDGGWVVVHNFSSDAPVTENFIGVSAYLEPGEYENLPIELGGDRAAASVPEESGTYRLSAMAHQDNPGDRAYKFPESVDGEDRPNDPPYTDDDGNIVQAFADVTFE